MGNSPDPSFAPTPLVSSCVNTLSNLQGFRSRSEVQIALIQDVSHLFFRIENDGITAWSQGLRGSKHFENEVRLGLFDKRDVNTANF